MFTSISSDISNINQYHALTRGGQEQSTDVEEATAQMGLPRQFALLKGTIFYDGYPVVMPDGELMKDQFYSKYSFFKVAAFYITNPSALGKQLDKASQNGFETRPTVLGNYQKADGKKVATTDCARISHTGSGLLFPLHQSIIFNVPIPHFSITPAR